MSKYVFHNTKLVYPSNMVKRKQSERNPAENTSSRHKVIRKEQYNHIGAISEATNSIAKQNRVRDQESKIKKEMTSNNMNTSHSSTLKSVKKNKNKNQETENSSDEERWLDAMESGKLEHIDDELKRIKNPKLMTARQRALYDRSSEREQSAGREMLLSLPIGSKKKELTADAVHKAQLKSQRRKQMADEKREKDKKKTMDRLLKKQETKQRFQGKNRVSKTVEPMIVYRSTSEGNTISLPPDFEFPLAKQSAKSPPKPILCGIEGCTNLKKYNCSKTNVPLCSLQCYQKNLLTV